MNGKDTKQLIKVAKERLRWYTLEASEAEYDEEEVEALVNLLNTLEPIETVEEQSNETALERFHEYVKMREAEEDTASKFSLIKYSRNIVFVKNYKIVSTVAAIFILIIVAGGSLGAVNAGKGNGFFYWLNRDEKGITMITSPENMGEGLMVEKEIEYTSIEEIPEEYRRYLVDLDDIEQLKTYELKDIRSLFTKNYHCIKAHLKDDSGKKEICIGAFIFYDRVSLTSEAYLSEEVQYGSIGESEEILERENPNGDSEHLIYFYKNNTQYFVEGNVEKKVLIEIIKEVRNKISE